MGEGVSVGGVVEVSGGGVVVVGEQGRGMVVVACITTRYGQRGDRGDDAHRVDPVSGYKIKISAFVKKHLPTRGGWCGGL